MASTISLMNAAALVKKVYFPREIIPAAVVLFNLIQTLLALVVFLPSMLVLRGGIPWALVFYPIVLALFALFSTGIALGLSALTVTFRDLRHLTEVVLAMLFWITPIVYSISMVPERLRVIFAFNPLTPFVSAFQDTAYWGRVPQPAVFLTMAIWAVGVLLVGWVIFRRLAPYLAEDL
jgi:ABC-2 type transport system permease protein